VARWAQAKPFEAYAFEVAPANARAQKVEATAPVSTLALMPPSAAGTPLVVKNESNRTLYATVAVRGIARSGEEDSSLEGLDIDIAYSDASGKPLTDVTRLTQGSDLIADITVRNTSKRKLTNLALTQMVPAGWEIRNERMDGGEALGEHTEPPRANPYLFWWIPDGSRDATSKEAEYVDIRDDRVMQYFALGREGSIHFRTRLNAAYLGRYYLPGTSAEAMYDGGTHARLKGQWVEVVSRGK
jgi:uncharacterized protein YfaS (alpha-2-macroglobulin family)